MSQPATEPATPAPDEPRATSEAAPRATLKLPLLAGAVGVAVAAVLVARAYHRPPPPVEPPPPGMTVGKDAVKLAADAPQWSSIKLAAATAAEPRWTDPIPARVVFDETRTSRMGSPLAGRVTAVLAERGQHIKAGAPLFTVSSPGLAELRSARDKAVVERTTAKANLDRIQALVDAQSLPAKELVTARQDVAEAELAVRLAEQKLASLRIAGAGDATFTVSAPRDGVVVEKNVAVGQEVEPETGALLAVADLSQVWVVVDLFESDVGGLAGGAKAKVTVEGGAADLDGTVDQVSAVVDPDRHTVPVRVKLANPEGALRPNAYAQVRFFDPVGARASVPASAIMSDGAQSYVYVKTAAGELKRRDVTVGAVAGGRVPILAGLEVGEQVVAQGAILLDNQIQLDN